MRLIPWYMRRGLPAGIPLPGATVTADAEGWFELTHLAASMQRFYRLGYPQGEGGGGEKQKAESRERKWGPWTVGGGRWTVDLLPTVL